MCKFLSRLVSRQYVILVLTPAPRPIYSYGNQACGKPGCRPEHHGIIHEAGTQAQMLSNEPNLGFSPIRAESWPGIPPLIKSSRVNYAKPVSVEHNVPVQFIGEVLQDDFPIALQAVRKCIFGEET